MTHINLSPGASLEHLVGRVIGGTIPKLLTVSGGTCSGKTTLVAKLIARLNVLGFSTACVPLDEYYKDLDDPSFPIESDSLIFDKPEAYYEREFVTHVHDLCEGRPIALPHYDMATNRRQPDTTQLASADFIIAEGLFATHFLRASPHTAFHVFMNLSPQECLDRRIERDVHIRKLAASPLHVINAFTFKVLPFWNLQYRYNQPHAQLIVES